MNEKVMRGVYPILVTPFDERERVDVDSLQNLIEFQLAAGVHGLGIALGAEVQKLTEAERSLVTRTVVEQVRGRVPVVMNTGGASTTSDHAFGPLGALRGWSHLLVRSAGDASVVTSNYRKIRKLYKNVNLLKSINFSTNRIHKKKQVRNSVPN